jgi:hypothetical protein
MGKNTIWILEFKMVRIYLNAEYVAITALLFYLGRRWKTPSYSICPRCGIEFGYEDSSENGILYAGKNFFKMKLMAMTNRCRISAAS